MEDGWWITSTTTNRLLEDTVLVGFDHAPFIIARNP
jgi:hypothetical protein